MLVSKGFAAAFVMAAVLFQGAASAQVDGGKFSQSDSRMQPAQSEGRPPTASADSGLVCFDCDMSGGTEEITPRPPVFMDTDNSSFPLKTHCPDGSSAFEVKYGLAVCIDSLGKVLYPVPDKPLAAAPENWDSLYGSYVLQLGPVSADSPAAKELSRHRTGISLREAETRKRYTVSCPISESAIGLIPVASYFLAGVSAGDYRNAWCWLETNSNIAAFGEENVQLLAGIAYEMGWGDRGPDRAGAFTFYQGLDDHQTATGKYLVARAYALGIGTARDEVKASEWMAKALSTAQGREIVAGSVRLQGGEIPVDLTELLKPEACGEAY